MRPDEDPLGDPSARERLRERVRERPDVVVQARARCAAACQQRSVTTTPAIMNEDEVRLAEVRALEARAAARPCGSTTAVATPASTSTTKRSTSQPNQRLAPEPRQLGVLVDRGDHRHHDRREEHEEAPEDERVHQPGHEPLQQLALAEHDLDLVLHAPRDVGRAVVRLARARTCSARNFARASALLAADERRAAPRTTAPMSRAPFAARR